nr:hypothetical protein [bacterium]
MIGATRQFPQYLQLPLHAQSSLHQVIDLHDHERGDHDERILGLYPSYDLVML